MRTQLTLVGLTLENTLDNLNHDYQLELLAISITDTFLQDPEIDQLEQDWGINRDDMLEDLYKMGYFQAEEVKIKVVKDLLEYAQQNGGLDAAVDLVQKGLEHDRNFTIDNEIDMKTVIITLCSMKDYFVCIR